MFWGEKGKQIKAIVPYTNKEFNKNKIWTVHLPVEMTQNKYFVLEAWQEAVNKGFPDMLTQDQVDFSYKIDEGLIPPRVVCYFAIKGV